MRKLLASALLFWCSIVSASQYSQFVLYKSGAQSLPTSHAASWQEPSNAYTAITIPFPFDAFKAQGVSVARADVQVVWAANSAGGNTGVMVLACPPQPSAESGLVGCVNLAFFAANNSGPAPYTPGCGANPGGPMTCRADVTALINSLIEIGVPYYLTISSYGNGISGPLIWDVELLINWTQ